MNGPSFIIPQPYSSTIHMQEGRPSEKQLSEQLLRLEHLRALPDLMEEILSTVQSVEAQMEFEEREYHLLQEREIVANERVVYAIREKARNVQDQKKIISLVGNLYSIGVKQTERNGDKRIRQQRQQLSSINTLYDRLSEKLDRVEKKIECLIDMEVRVFQDIPREEGSTFDEVTPAILRMSAQKRLEKAIGRIQFIRKSQERRLKALSLDQWPDY